MKLTTAGCKAEITALLSQPASFPLEFESKVSFMPSKYLLLLIAAIKDDSKSVIDGKNVRTTSVGSQYFF